MLNGIGDHGDHLSFARNGLFPPLPSVILVLVRVINHRPRRHHHLHQQQLQLHYHCQDHPQPSVENCNNCITHYFCLGGHVRVLIERH